MGAPITTQPKLLVVCGPSTVGKTTLLSELKWLLAESNTRVTFLSADEIFAQLRQSEQLKFLAQHGTFVFTKFKRHLLGVVQAELTSRARLAGRSGSHVLIDDIRALCFLQHQELQFMCPRAVVVFSPFARVASNLAARNASASGTADRREVGGVLQGFIEWFTPSPSREEHVLVRDELDHFDVCPKMHEKLCKHFKLTTAGAWTGVEPNVKRAGTNAVIARGDQTRRAAVFLMRLLRRAD